MSPLGFGLGLAMLAGAVFLLQRLRIQRIERVVPTLIFWQAALRDTQARKLTERFRQPLVFLLLLGICALLWTAAALPSWQGQTKRNHWIVVDDSFAMARGTRLADALELARDQAARAPRQSTSVWLLGSDAAPLLLPGEALELWDTRAQALAAEGAKPVAMYNATPTQVAAWLADQIAATPTDQGLTVTLVASPPVIAAGQAALDALAQERPALTLEWLPVGLQENADSANEGLLDLRAEPAASGQADRADVWIETTGAPVTLTSEAASLSVETLATGAAIATDEARATRRYVVRDVALDGATWTATIASQDALLAYNTATLTLPIFDTLNVALDASLTAGEGALSSEWAAALRSIVSADSGLREDSANAAVALRFGSGNGTDAELVIDPTLDTLQVRGPNAAAFRALFDSLGLAALPTGLPTEQATAPAEELTLEILVTAGAHQVHLPAKLIAPPFEWSQERRLPLVVALSLRWLAGDNQATFRGAVSADLVGRSVTLEAPSDLPRAPQQASLGQAKLWPWLALVALGLLLFEWRQVARGQMP